MKKFLISLLSLLVCVPLLIMAGCGAGTILSFTNAWNASYEGNIEPGFFENTEYNVTYTDSFSSGNFNYKKNDALNSVQFGYANGKYIQNVSIMSSSNVKTEIEGMKSPDLMGESDVIIAGETYCKLYTKFSIDFTFNEQTYNDYVESTTFFALKEVSFAPIYNQSKYDFHNLSIENNTYVAKSTIYSTEILYNQTNYKTLLVYNGAKELKTYNYNFKTVIDNGELLFALRNTPLEKGKSSSLPTVLTAYGNPTTLTISCFDQSTDKVSVNVNGSQKDDVDLTVNCFAYKSSTQNAQGKDQLVYIQCASNEQVGNRAIITKYITPLTTDVSFISMGALEYSVKTLTYGKN